MCRPTRIPLNADQRTARRSVPATFVGCVMLGFQNVFQEHLQVKNENSKSAGPPLLLSILAA